MWWQWNLCMGMAMRASLSTCWWAIKDRSNKRAFTFSFWSSHAPLKLGYKNFLKQKDPLFNTPVLYTLALITSDMWAVQSEAAQFCQERGVGSLKVKTLVQLGDPKVHFYRFSLFRNKRFLFRTTTLMWMWTNVQIWLDLKRSHSIIKQREFLKANS